MKRCGFYQSGFTLIELLIVIGLLGALAALLLSNLSMDRTETLDTSIVQKEIHDIRRAFQRFHADCVPDQDDCKRITKYGLEILCKCDPARGWSFPVEWDVAKGKGWRGPYIEREGVRTVNIAATDDIAKNGQPEGGATTADIPVICTPYVNDDDGNTGDYYRVIPEIDTAAAPDRVIQLWVVFPSHSGELDAEVITRIAERNPVYVSDLAKESAKRRLLLSE